MIGTTNFPASLDTATELIRAVNDAATTIGVGGATNVATTINVVSAASAPADGIAVIVSATDDAVREIIAFTGKTATTLTGVTRGLESSGAKTWLAGALVYFDAVTAIHHGVLSSVAIALETKVGRGSSTPTKGLALLGGASAGESIWALPLGWYNVQAYGAVGNGSTNDQAAIAAAIAAVPSGGGTLYFPPGNYVCASGIDVSDRRSIIFRGAGGLNAGAAGASILTFTGSGSGIHINCKSSYGIRFEDLQILYTHASFTGTVIDCRQSATATDTAYFGMKNCLVLGSGVRAADTLVNLDRAIISDFSHCLFGHAATLIRGRGAATYSVKNHFRSCTFGDSTTYHIRNGGESWTFDGCTFEPICNSGGARTGAGAYFEDYISEGLSFNGCWFGDANNTGEWVTFSGRGLVFQGNKLGSGLVGVRLLSGAKGVFIAGNGFEAVTGATFAIAVNSGVGSGLVIQANMFTSYTTPLTIGGLPSGSIMQNSELLTLDIYGLHTYAGDVSDAQYGSPPPDGTIALSNKGAIWSRIGGVWAVHASPRTIRQLSDYVATNGSAAQKVFNASANGAVTLVANTTYEFEAVYLITSLGTTARTLSVLFGGTAGIGFLKGVALSIQPTTNIGATPAMTQLTSSAARAVTASVSAAVEYCVKLHGIVGINATGGTFIPQIQFSAAPGSTQTVRAGSFMTLTPLGSDSLATIGAWS